jgi:hypothetical protein
MKKLCIGLAVGLMTLGNTFASDMNQKIVNREGIISKIIEASRNKSIDPATALAVAEKESDFNPRARRWEEKLKTASLGLFQVLVTTARAQLGFEGASRQMYDPDINIQLGLSYINQCYVQVGKSLADLSCCYQAGFEVKKKFPKLCSSIQIKDYFKDLQLKKGRWIEYVQEYESVHQKETQPNLFAWFRPERTLLFVDSPEPTTF